MGVLKSWKYDYANKCDCSDDDNCGCAFPQNMKRNFSSQLDWKISAAYEYNHARVGEMALNFTAPAVLADGKTTLEFNFFNYIADSYALLYFYLADFSATCPAEIIALNRSYQHFYNRNVKLIAVSVDSLDAHMAWRRMPFSEGGIGQVQFPLVSDINKTAALEYGVLRPDGKAQRATFIVDKDYVIRYQAVYDNKVERNVEEVLRVTDKLVEYDEAKCRGLQCLMQ